MKTSTLLASVSLLGNAVLVAALVLGSPAQPPASAVRSPPATPTDAMPGAAPVRPADVSVPVPHLWARVRGGSLDEFNRQLRAAGFPSREVRALLAMAITEEVTARREAILGKATDTPYWRTPGQASGDPRIQAELNEISRESRALNFQYVNGPDALAEDEDLLVAAQRQFGQLPLGKLQRLTAMQQELYDRNMKASAAAILNPDPAARTADAESLRNLRAAHLAEVTSLLTPVELEQYELRNQASTLRRNLTAFRPTEEEFKALYALEKQSTAARLPRDQQLAQVEALLGPDRFAEYSVLQTSDGRGQLAQLMTWLDLPLTTITTVNAVRDDISARAKTIGANPALTAAQRETQLTALAEEADHILTGTLGARGYEAYADRGGGWIRALTPRK